MDHFLMTYISGSVEEKVYVRLLLADSMENATRAAVKYMASVEPDYRGALIDVQYFNGEILFSNIDSSEEVIR